eukprot:SAG11_NODE_663_length_7869_cov_146.101158_8_plen_62_part_00
MPLARGNISIGSDFIRFELVRQSTYTALCQSNSHGRTYGTACSLISLLVPRLTSDLENVSV